MGLPTSPQQQAWPFCPAVTEGWTPNVGLPVSLSHLRRFYLYLCNKEMGLLEWERLLLI